MNDEDIVCSVCRDGGWTETNRIIVCDGCSTPVHQNCYGIQELPESNIPWFCSLCIFNRQGRKPIAPICLLCHEGDGAFKQVNDRFWVHCTCVLAVPESSFRDIIKLEMPRGYDSFAIARRKTKICTYCNKLKGVTVSCSIKSCSELFHIGCGQANQAIFQLRGTSGEKKAFCQKHRNHFFRNFGPNQISDVEYQKEIDPKVQELIKSPQKRQLTDKELWDLVESYDIPFNEAKVKQFLGGDTTNDSKKLSKLTKSVLTPLKDSIIDFEGMKPDFRFDLAVKHSEFNQSYVKPRHNEVLKCDKRVHEVFSIKDGKFVETGMKHKSLKGTEFYDRLFELSQLASVRDQSTFTEFNQHNCKVDAHRAHILNEAFRTRLTQVIFENEPQLFEKLKLELPLHLRGINEPFSIRKSTITTEKPKKRVLTFISSLDQKRRSSSLSLVSLYNTTTVRVIGPRDFSSKGIQDFINSEGIEYKRKKMKYLEKDMFQNEYTLFQLGYPTPHKIAKTLSNKRKLNSKAQQIRSAKKSKKLKPKLMIYVTCTGNNQFMCSLNPPKVS